MKRKIEIILITLYTVAILKMTYPFLYYFVPETWGEFSNTEWLFVSLNINLIALCLGIFSCIFLTLYRKIFTKEKYELIALIVYTFINLKLLSTPFFHYNTSYSFNTIYDIQGFSFTLFPLFVGLFLNVVVFIYWFNKKRYD